MNLSSHNSLKTLIISIGRECFGVFGAHRLIEVRDRLNAVFGNNRIIGLGHDVEWPPRSLDLTPCDFFLWGYIKDKVFSTPPRDIHELRQKLIREFNALREQPAFIRRPVRDMHRRTMLCVAREGGCNALYAIDKSFPSLKE